MTLLKSRKAEVENRTMDYVQVQLTIYKQLQRKESVLWVSGVWGLESISLRKSGKASWLRWNVEACFPDGLEKCGSVGRRGAFHTYPFAV